MNQFSFEGKLKRNLIIMMIVGLVTTIITYLVGGADAHMRFWTNFLHNSVFFTGIAFMAIFFLSASITAQGGWITTFKRIWEAYSMFLLVGLILMTIVVIGLFIPGGHNLYHWNIQSEVVNDELIAHKAPFINKGMYAFFTIIVIGVWYFFAKKIRSISLKEDEEGQGEDYKSHRNLIWWTAPFLLVAGYTSVGSIWQWLMSLDAHWYSTMYAWYATISWLVAMLALTIMSIIYLKGKGYLEEVSDDHLHDLGKYLFGFSIFWTYLWFSQFMLIWYSNNGEETVYFKIRQDHFPILYWANLLINFLLPFLVLLRNSNKRKHGVLMLVSVMLFFGHWLDFFQMVKPGAMHTQHIAELAEGHNDPHAAETKDINDHGSDAHAEETHGDHAKDTHSTEAHEAHDSHGEVAHEGDGHHGDEHGDGHAHGTYDFKVGYSIPGFLEIGMFIGFLGLFLFMFFRQLSMAALIPKNDPYLEESKHHHV